MVAVCLLDGGAGFESSHDKARMTDPEVLTLREKMTTTPSPELTAAKPARQAIVEIETKDGKAFRHHTIAVRGTPNNPMPPEDVKAKARDLIAPILGDATAQSLIEAVWHLEDLADIRSLSAIVEGVRM